jgi:hypothetical protein
METNLSQEPHLITSSSIIHLDKDRPVPHPNTQPPQPVAQPVPPRPQPPQPVQPQVRPKAQPASKPPEQPKEEARIVQHAAPQPRAAPQTQRQATLAEQLAQQQAAFEKQTEAMRASRNPLSVATIDPSQRESSTKSYAMNISGIEHATGPGEGLLTPLQSWHDHGYNCYYGRYDWIYPDGAMEHANIPWPFCYAPAQDPIARGIREFPFPLPPPGYRTSPTDLAPIEQRVYQAWLSMQ